MGQRNLRHSPSSFCEFWRQKEMWTSLREGPPCSPVSRLTSARERILRQRPSMCSSFLACKVMAPPAASTGRYWFYKLLTPGPFPPASTQPLSAVPQPHRCPSWAAVTCHHRHHLLQQHNPPTPVQTWLTTPGADHPNAMHQDTTCALLPEAKCCW